MQYFVCLWFHSWKYENCIKCHLMQCANLNGYFIFKKDDNNSLENYGQWYCSYIYLNEINALANELHWRHSTYVVLALENKCGGRWLGELCWWSGAFAVVALFTRMLIFCIPLNLLSLLFCWPSRLLSSVDFTCDLWISFALLMSHWFSNSKWIWNEEGKKIVRIQIICSVSWLLKITISLLFID